MNNEVVDSTQVDNLLDTLDNDEIRRNILFSAVKAGGMVLKKQTIQNLKSSGFKASPEMENGIRVKGDKDYIEATVSIMGEHKLKWFETGTEPRYVKRYKNKARYTGSIKPYYFFRNARSNETAITDAMMQSIDNALRNLNIQ